MPHGENVILVLDEDGAVERAIFKDIAEEIAVMDPDAVLPPAVERIRADVPEDMKLLSIFTDVFDCFLRFLSDLRWFEGRPRRGRLLADGRRLRARLPGVRARTSRTSSGSTTCSRDEFALSCLNRLQLRNNQQMVDLADPAGRSSSSAP